MTIRQWIIKTFFQKELNAVLETATRLGSLDAFEKARDDVEQMMIDRTDEKAEILAEERLSGLLTNVDLRKIVSTDKSHGVVYIGGVKAEPQQLMNLKQEAEALEQFDLWTLMQETPKELAQRAMFVQGESLDEMKKGRSILYTLSTQKNILETFKSYTPK